MRRILLPALVWVTLGSVAMAACPTPEAPLSERAPDLFDALHTAQSENESRAHEDMIWRQWVTAPDAEAQALLDDGMRRIRQSDLDGAVAALDALIARCPGFAEGYNQRAHARFLQGRLDAALEDIDRTLAREPKHFGALSGRLRIFYTQGRILLARKAMRDALDVNPWLRERRLIPIEPLGRKT